LTCEHRERQESQQSLYGLDAELKEKEQVKLSMAEYKKLVDDAMDWLEKILGDKGVGSFPDNLKSGRVLCALINKVPHARLTHVHARTQMLMLMMARSIGKA
jgi:hypothetical protein